MKEIEKKLNELLEMLEQRIPNECKGESEEAHNKRVRFLSIRMAIRSLLNDNQQ